MTDFDRGRIISLREAGWSNRRIRSERYGLLGVGNSGSIPSRRVRTSQEQNDSCNQKSGQPTTSLHRFNATVLLPSRETIRRRLTEVGLRSRRPLRRLPLTPSS
ncbi:hypothetical protein TNCV_292521 [Trichonephila clavipes]|nr:hypothetical protein TNCV_292521 [Trichonephila clavipes]